MSDSQIPGKYSLGIGDRFGQEGEAQMKAIIEAGKNGIDITPVWNKSNREHLTIGTSPEDVRNEADYSIKSAGFSGSYFVDADHINLDTVDRFISSSNWFTIDVASAIGTESDQASIDQFISDARKYVGDLKIEGIPRPYIVTHKYLSSVAGKYLFAARKAAEIFQKISRIKGPLNYVSEISMDEVNAPQRPSDLFFVLMMLAGANVPVQALAPKFTGRFKKGIDYEGDPTIFMKEFEEDILIIDRVVKEFGLPRELKLSIHSGSDKFSLYPEIGNILRKLNKGIHIKTAGTTWLEEITGLSVAGGEAFKFARDICIEALERQDELCAPYRDVIEIHEKNLPSKNDLKSWDNFRLADTIRHIPGNSLFNPHFRQLVHVAYKIAAERIQEFFHHLDRNRQIVSGCVFDNLYNRHICRIFGIEEIAIKAPL